MEIEANIEGKKIGLRVTAGTVCTYREIFGRDMILDMSQLEKELLETKALSMETTAIAERAIWIMAKEYDPEIRPMREWLDQFSPFFTYTAAVHIINMWVENLITRNESKKN